MLQVVVTLAILSLLAFVIIKPFDDIVDASNEDDYLSDENKAVMNDMRTQFPAWFDGAIATLMIVAWILLMVFGTLVNEHPVYFLLAILFSICLMFIAVELANSYDDTVGDEDFTEFRDEYPMTDWIVTHLLTVVIVFFVTTSLAAYAGATR